MQHRVQRVKNWLRATTRSNHVHALMVQVASAVFGFATFMLFTRWLESDQLGLLILFISAATLLDMLRSGFLQPALVREIQGVLHNEDHSDQKGRNPDGSRYDPTIVRGSAQALGLLWSAGTAGVLLVLAQTGFFKMMTSHSDLFGYVWPALVVASFPGQYFGWQAQAASRFDRILVYRLMNGVGILGCTIGLHLAGRLDPQSIAMSFVVVSILLGLFLVFSGWIRGSDVFSATRSGIVSLARFGRYSMTTTLGTSLLKSSDTFLIGYLLDTKAVAVYGVAQKVVEVLDLPLRALSSSVYPLMAGSGANGEATRVGRIIERVSSGYVLALLIPAVGLFAAAGPLVHMIAGPGYQASVPVIRVFVLAAFLLPVDRMMGLGLDSLGRPDVNLMKVAVMLTCNVIGDYWVLSVWGSLSGTAFVTVVMSSVGMLTGWMVLQPMVKMSWRRSASTFSYWMTPSYVRLQLTKSGRTDGSSDD